MEQHCTVINTMHGGGNPTTFARMQLIPTSLSAEAVKPYRFFDPVHYFVRFKPHHVQKPWLLS
jgi:hypothetical protein